MFDEQFWRTAPKVFCDDAGMVTVSGVGDMFLLALKSGGNPQVFAFTPEHVKRFSQLVQYHIGQFEKTKGAIKMEDWTPEPKAPFQIKDLKK
jgi:hypothetical protein